MCIRFMEEIMFSLNTQVRDSEVDRIECVRVEGGYAITGIRQSEKVVKGTAEDIIEAHRIFVEYAHEAGFRPEVRPEDMDWIRKQVIKHSIGQLNNKFMDELDIADCTITASYESETGKEEVEISREW